MSTVITLHPHSRREQLHHGRPALRVVSGPEPTPKLARPVAAEVFQAVEFEPAPIRLTRRGRRVVQAVVGALLLVVIGAGVLLLTNTAEAGSRSQTVPLGYHVVLPGETLWQIAGEVAPGTDRRDTVDTLMELNALSSAGVTVGQRVAYPVNSSRP